MGSVNLGKVGLTPKGPWLNSIEYRRLDLVEYQGSSYVVVTDVTPVGALPTNAAYYKLHAAKGDPGLKGDPGPIGPGGGGNIAAWSAANYASGLQVNYSGKIWKANADTISTDIPGTSAKWDELLTSYAGLSGTTINLLDNSKMVPGTINASGGFQSSATNYVSDFIPVKANTIYSTWRLLNNAIARGVGVTNIISFYTSAKTWITPLYTGGNTAGITSPATAAFMRLSVATTSLDSHKLMMLIEGDIQPDRLYRFGAMLSKYALIEKENVEQAISDSANPVLSALLKTSNGITQKQLSFMSKTINLFDFNAAVSGAMNTTTGANIADATFIRSDYIEAKPDTNYSLWNTLPLIARVATSGTAVFFYDASKAIITPNVSLVSGAAQSPGGTAFMRFHIKRTDVNLNKRLMLTEGDVLPSKFSAYGFSVNYDVDIPAARLEAPLLESSSTIIESVTKQNKWLLPENAAFMQIGINMYDSSKSVFGKSINTSNGNEVTSSGFFSTPFLPMSFGENYLFTRNTSVGPSEKLSSFAQAVWYKADKTFHSSATANSGIYTPPDASAVYFRGSMLGNDTSGWQFIKGTITPKRFTPYGYIFDSSFARLDIRGKWFDKNWGMLGDSFTVQNKYGQAVCDRTGLVQALNQGSNGALLKTRADGLTSENIAPLHIISCMGGTNDFGHGTATYGSITDTKEMNTIQGNVAYVADKVLTLKPDVRLIFITQPNRGYYATEPNWTPPQPNNNGLTMENISRAIVEKCRYMGIPCLDLFSLSGLNEYNFGIYTDDGLHPNAVFGAKIGDLIGEFINNLNT